MTQTHDQSRKSEWQRYQDRKAIAVDAAQRARNTHKDRRALEAAEWRARRAAQIDLAIELARTRRARAAELEVERIELERRGVDPASERRAMAKVRRDAAALSRDQSLTTVATNRPKAISSAAHQAAETAQEHAVELATANDTNSREYRAAIEVRVDTAARLRQYRADREVEQAKLAGERQAAAALMAHQARHTRKIREMGEIDAPVAIEMERPKLRALAALMSEVSASNDVQETTGQKNARMKREAEKSEAEINEMRRTLAARRKNPTTPDLSERPDHDSSDQSEGRGMFKKMFGRGRRAA